MTDLTRTALRAALAAFTASLVAHFITFQRPYWTILVAVVVMNDTWGSSLRKTFQRVGMTAAGCVVGWALHAVVPDRPGIEMAFLLISVFFAAYFRKGSYPWMTFFITVYVAFLFTVTGQWTATLMFTRLEDTAVGGAVAIGASLVVPPRRVSRTLREQLVGFWDSCREHVAAGFALLQGDALPGYDWQSMRRDLLVRVEKLRAQERESLYENLLRVRSRQRNERIVRNTELLCNHALGFGRAARNYSGPGSGLEQWEQQIMNGFERLKQFELDDLAKPPAHVPWPADRPEPIYYFGRRLDELLREINRDL